MVFVVRLCYRGLKSGARKRTTEKRRALTSWGWGACVPPRLICNTDVCSSHRPILPQPTLNKPCLVRRDGTSNRGSSRPSGPSASSTAGAGVGAGVGAWDVSGVLIEKKDPQSSPQSRPSRAVSSRCNPGPVSGPLTADQRAAIQRLALRCGPDPASRLTSTCSGSVSCGRHHNLEPLSTGPSPTLTGKLIFPTDCENPAGSGRSGDSGNSASHETVTNDPTQLEKNGRPVDRMLGCGGAEDKAERAERGRDEAGAAPKSHHSARLGDCKAVHSLAQHLQTTPGI
ncbi:hypothetical protein QBC39DRAFT_100555 [Podospora conica]|nr:hypothetical protein QBC39DRAFT_100555 [Schizothecium conicum]